MESAPVFANDFGRYLYIFYWPPAEPLSGAHGTLRSHGTPQLKITGLDHGCCVFPNNAPGLKLPSWYTRSSTAVHRRTLAHSLDVADCQVAEGFALPEATASSSLRFTAPLLAAEHFRLLAPQVWNCLPPEVTSAPSLATFRIRLGTFLFTESYPDILVS